MADWKVRLSRTDNTGGLISIQNGANRAAAEAAALADGSAGSDDAAIDIERLDSTEASLRGMATQTTLAAIAVDVAALAEEAADSTNTRASASLANGATFTGGFVDLSGYEGISVSVVTDQDSAASGLVISWSDDGSTSIISQSYTVSASSDFSEQLPRRARYYRVVYTNGGVTATTAITTRKLPRFASLGTANVPGHAVNYLYNGSTWEEHRSNQNLTLLSSAARTATVSSSDQTNYNARGIKVVLSVTSAGTGSITLTIEGKDSISGAYYTILSGAAVTTNSTNVYSVYPGMAVSANVSASDFIPRTFRITSTHNNANAITYSVSGSLIL